MSKAAGNELVITAAKLYGNGDLVVKSERDHLISFDRVNLSEGVGAIEVACGLRKMADNIMRNAMPHEPSMNTAEFITWYLKKRAEVSRVLAELDTCIAQKQSFESIALSANSFVKTANLISDVLISMGK